MARVKRWHVAGSMLLVLLIGASACTSSRFSSPHIRVKKPGPTFAAHEKATPGFWLDAEETREMFFRRADRSVTTSLRALLRVPSNSAGLPLRVFEQREEVFSKEEDELSKGGARFCLRKRWAALTQMAEYLLYRPC